MRICCALILSAVGLIAQTPKPANAVADWPMYNRDSASTRYSPLKQIDIANVAKLTQTWTFTTATGAPAASRAGAGRGGAGIGAEVTPIVVNGIMYVPAANLVVAVDTDGGKEVWRYQLSRGEASTRGVSYWPGDKDNPPRIIFTSGNNLIALNANTGKIDPGFGKEGMVDMVVGYSGVPTIFKNTVMVGASVLEVPKGPPGNTRAYDARTGAKMWEFHTVPQPGEVGHETWLGTSGEPGWKDRSGTNVWGWQMTVDEARGLLFMPVGGPASNYYGGDRPGANLFGNSIVAVDAVTGKYKWHFQTVHHDLWDYDTPPAPVLLDVTIKDGPMKGKKVPVLAQVGKTGWMFILDRETGKPVFGVEERPVPAGDVPGEWYSPTQPFPLKPPHLGRIDFKPEDMVTAEDTTPEHAKACKELYDKSGGFYNAGAFTPFLYHADGTPPKSSLIFPGATGGTNWGGMAIDPKSGYVFAYTQDLAQVGWTEKKKPGVQYAFDERGSDLLYTRASVDGPGPFHTFSAPVKDANGKTVGVWPCQKPPWGLLNAVDVKTGTIAWQVPLGITEQLPPAKQHTGRSVDAFAGPTATAGGLVFIGSVNDNRFRAFDSKNGRELWSFDLHAVGGANPMVFQGKNGKEYVAIVAGRTVHTFALP
jgi:quinoprotein glucose dehydrogenase